MPNLIDVPISAKTFARLQRLAEPLIDDTNSVIERLIDHWETNPPVAGTVARQTAPTEKAAAEVWRSPRGDVLPVGSHLKAEYLGKAFHAIVEKRGINFGGETFGNLSAAGAAVKGGLGRKGRATSTNGRDFWKIQDPVSEQWIPIKALRPSRRVSAGELFAEIESS